MLALIAEKDDVLRGVLSRELFRAGWVVLQLRDGPGLLDLLAEAHGMKGGRRLLDLLVVSARLPVLDGLFVLATLAHLGWSIPVVVLCDPDDHPAREESRRLGARMVLNSPPDLAALRHVVGRGVRAEASPRVVSAAAVP
jgi:DNA-binding response OmpR family regulator